MDVAIALIVVAVILLVVAVLGYVLRANETPYEERVDDSDEFDGGTRKVRRRKNVDRKKKSAGTTNGEEPRSASPTSKNQEIPTVVATTSEQTESRKSPSAAQPSTASKKPVEKSPQAKPAGKAASKSVAAVEKQGKPAASAEKSPKASATDSTDGLVKSRLSTQPLSKSSEGAGKKSPSPTPAATASGSKAENQKASPGVDKAKKASPAPAKPKAVQAPAASQQKTKPKKKASLDGIREQLDELDLGQSECLDLVEFLKERAEQQGTWVKKGTKGPIETLSSVKTRCEQLVGELESTRQAHTQHLHQISTKRVELQEENKRLRLQNTEIQAVNAKRELDLKQYITRVHNLEDDLANASKPQEVESNDTTLVDENTRLKMDLSHLQSRMDELKDEASSAKKEVPAAKPTSSDDKVPGLERRIADLEASLKKEQALVKSNSTVASSKLEVAQDKIGRLEKRITQVEEASAQPSEADTSSDSIAELTRLCDEWKTKAEQSDSVLNDTNEILGDLQGRITDVEKSHEAELEVKTAACQKALADLSALRTQLDEVKAQVPSEDLGKQVSDLRSQLEKAGSSEEALREELSVSRTKSESLQSQITLLEEQNATLRRSSQGDSSEV